MPLAFSPLVWRVDHGRVRHARRLDAEGRLLDQALCGHRDTWWEWVGETGECTAPECRTCARRAVGRIPRRTTFDTPVGG